MWWALDEITGADIALKLTPASSDARHTSRFLREAEILRRFQHRNIVRVLEAGELEDEGDYFLAMELLRGSSLADRLAPGEPLAVEAVMPVLVDVCRGLEEAHGRGVVHRDVKPENIFLAVLPGEGIVAKILDFGISKALDQKAAAKITAKGQVLGTPAYMSPEQATGKSDITAAADLWSLGVILHEAVSGKPPFTGRGQRAILQSIVDDPPAELPSWVDDETRAIVARCLQKDPTRRPASATALREDLERALARRVTRASATTIPTTHALLPRAVPSSPPRSGRPSTKRARPASQALPSYPHGPWLAVTLALAAAVVAAASVERAPPLLRLEPVIARLSLLRAAAVR